MAKQLQPHQRQAETWAFSNARCASKRLMPRRRNADTVPRRLIPWPPRGRGRENVEDQPGLQRRQLLENGSNFGSGFYRIMFIPFLGLLGIVGYYFLLVAVPFLAIRWWVKFGRIQADDSDFRRARVTVSVIGRADHNSNRLFHRQPPLTRLALFESERIRRAPTDRTGQEWSDDAGNHLSRIARFPSFGISRQWPATRQRLFCVGDDWRRA